MLVDSMINIMRYFLNNVLYNVFKCVFLLFCRCLKKINFGFVGYFIYWYENVIVGNIFFLYSNVFMIYLINGLVWVLMYYKELYF